MSNRRLHPSVAALRASRIRPVGGYSWQLYQQGGGSPTQSHSCGRERRRGRCSRGCLCEGCRERIPLVLAAKTRQCKTRHAMLTEGPNGRETRPRGVRCLVAVVGSRERGFVFSKSWWGCQAKEGPGNRLLFLACHHAAGGGGVLAGVEESHEGECVGILVEVRALLVRGEAIKVLEGALPLLHCGAAVGVLGLEFGESISPIFEPLGGTSVRRQGCGLRWSLSKRRKQFSRRELQRQSAVRCSSAPREGSLPAAGSRRRGPTLSRSLLRPEERDLRLERTLEGRRPRGRRSFLRGTCHRCL